MVLHVVRPQVLYGEVGTLVPTGEYRDVALAQLEQVLPPDPAVTVEHRLEEGAAAEWIIAVAEEVHANLIVMGTHGRTGLGRLLLGSVAEQVLRKAPCPVLTLKGAPAYAFAEAEPVLAGAGDQAASEGEGI
jgi:nucleotide-binding universal stress UspA family protein